MERRDSRPVDERKRMKNRHSSYLKNFLGLTALLLSLVCLQSPLWRPADVPENVTAKAGSAVIFAYHGDLEKAVIFRKRMATLSAGGPGKLVIHGHAAGKTSLLIFYKDGKSKLYDLVVSPG